MYVQYIYTYINTYTNTPVITACCFYLVKNIHNPTGFLLRGNSEILNYGAALQKN